jgi:cell division protein FtsL
MKKLIVFLLSVFLLLSFSSCAEPSDIEKVQQKVVSIGEQFLDCELTAEEAKAMLKGIKVPETEGHGKLYLEVDIGALSLLISKKTSTYEDIQRKIESIKNSVYE